MLSGSDIGWAGNRNPPPKLLHEGDIMSPIFPLDCTFHFRIMYLDAMPSPAGGRIKEGGYHNILLNSDFTGLLYRVQVKIKTPFPV